MFKGWGFGILPVTMNVTLNYFHRNSKGKQNHERNSKLFDTLPTYCIHWELEILVPALITDDIDFAMLPTSST